jgi:RimJ/RimL family protein N-acetyltransferase
MMYNIPMISRAAKTDNKLSIRPYRQSDVPLLHEAVRESLADLKPWMNWAHDMYDLDDAIEWIEMAYQCWNDGSYFGFAVIDAADGTFLGATSLSHIHPVYHFCNLGYWVRTGRRGQGIAGRAARLTARFAFEQLGLLRAEVVVAVENSASLRVAEKCGAHREGLLRNRMVVGNDVYDAVMFSFVPSDFA